VSKYAPADYTFRPARVGAAHFVWRPEVHAALREQCYYYLIRFRRPAYSGILNHLSKLLRRESLDSACVYLVYGHWDALVRVWATHSARDRFAQHLITQQSGDLLAVSEFRVDRIQYGASESTATRPVREADVTGELVDIRRVVLADSARELPQREDLQVVVDRLESRGLLAHVRSSPPDAIKFYTVFEPIDGVPWTRFQNDDVQSQLFEKLTNVGLDSISVYHGTGFAQSFVKSVAPDLPTVQRASLELADMTNGHLRPMTLILASEGAIEVDTIDEAKYLVGGRSVQNWEGVFDKEWILVLASAAPEIQEEVLGQLDHFAPLSTSESTGENFRDIFRGVVQNDVRALRQGLAFLPALEFELRQLLVRTVGPRLAADLGKPAKKWPELVRELADGSSSIGNLDREELGRPDLRPSDWSMSPVRSAILLAAQRSADIEVLVSGQLGRDWSATTETAVYVRNVGAHGRLFSAQPSELIRSGVEWRKDSRIFLRQILEALAVFHALDAPHVPMT